MLRVVIEMSFFVIVTGPRQIELAHASAQLMRTRAAQESDLRFLAQSQLMPLRPEKVH